MKSVIRLFLSKFFLFVLRFLKNASFLPLTNSFLLFFTGIRLIKTIVTLLDLYNFTSTSLPNSYS